MISSGEPVALSLQHVRVAVVREEGQRPTVVLDDGELAVELSTAAGSAAAAADRLVRVAATIVAVATA